MKGSHQKKQQIFSRLRSQALDGFWAYQIDRVFFFWDGTNWWFCGKTIKQRNSYQCQ